jgi:hypothetical protein
MLVEAEFSILSAQQPGAAESIPIGILMIAQDELFVRVRTRWDSWDASDADVLSALADDLAQLGRHLGAHRLVRYLEDTLSNTVQISDRKRLETDDPTEEIDRLYRLHVDSEA